MGLDKARHGRLRFLQLPASTLQSRLNQKAVCIAGRSDKTLSDDRGRLFAAVSGIKRLTMHIGVIFRCHGMQATGPLRISDSVCIVPEPDLRLGERHHAVGIVGVQLHRALRSLKSAGIVGLKRQPETDDLVAKTEIRIEAHGLPRFAEAQIQFRRGGLTAGPLRHFGDIGQRKARAGGGISRVHFQGALVQGHELRE